MCDIFGETAILHTDCDLELLPKNHQWMHSIFRRVFFLPPTIGGGAGVLEGSGGGVTTVTIGLATLVCHRKTWTSMGINGDTSDIHGHTWEGNP